MRLQEQLDKMREALSGSKKLNHKLTEKNQDLQRDLEDLQVKDLELEKHNLSLKEVGGSRLEEAFSGFEGSCAYFFFFSM